MKTNKLNIIVKVRFGSHLYGTATKDSDVDYKGVFLPTKEEILLNRIPKSYNFTTKPDNRQKNASGDIDEEIYSLHYFIKLACEGQTVGLDMLHAPDNMIIEKHPIWNEIVFNRDKFYTKNLKAFIGYARRQAAKYGIKGSRLNAARIVIDKLRRYDDPLVAVKMKDIWDLLPIGEHLHMLGKNENGVRQYQVCGKIIQETARVNYALSIIEKFYSEYGKRAQQAAENKGIDWKAISHAMRAALQVEELLIDNTITFPLKEAVLLTDIKRGKLDYTKEVAPMLETIMDRVEKLSEQSQLPAKPDVMFWNNFIINSIEKYVL